MNPFEKLDAAQRNYDRELPDDDDDVPRHPFNEFHVLDFIANFANSQDSAHEDLENMGYAVTDQKFCDLLRNLCRSWMRKNNDSSDAVFNVCGTEFWQLCKEIAQEIYFNEGRTK